MTTKSLFDLVSNIKIQENRIKEMDERKEVYTEEDYQILTNLIENDRPVRDKKLKRLQEFLIEGGLL
ncbi:MAG: hypothetical protein WC503_00695 [Candidatus Shapirobacteria bacterium]